MLRMMITTLHGKDGHAIPGTIAECGICGGREFVIIRVREQDHPHYQCTGCGISYCGTWDGTQCSDHEQRKPT